MRRRREVGVVVRKRVPQWLMPAFTSSDVVERFGLLLRLPPFLPANPPTDSTAKRGPARLYNLQHFLAVCRDTMRGWLWNNADLSNGGFACDRFVIHSRPATFLFSPPNYSCTGTCPSFTCRDPQPLLATRLQLVLCSTLHSPKNSRTYRQIIILVISLLCCSDHHEQHSVWRSWGLQLSDRKHILGLQAILCILASSTISTEKRRTTYCATAIVASNYAPKRPYQLREGLIRAYVTGSKSDLIVTSAYDTALTLCHLARRVQVLTGFP